jgi:hypothetical protein
MTQAQINRGQMIDAVITFMNKNTAKWSTIAIIGMLMSKLNELFEAITEHKEAQNSAKVFIHKNKNEQKRIVADKADILNDTLEAYADIEENAALENKADKSSSDLYKLRNEDFKTVITETITLLEGNLNNMADYGMTEPQITDLKTSFDNFLVMNGQPRQYRISSKVATESLKELFSKSSKLLDTKLDKLMKRYKNSDPNFYKGYLAARVVVDN